MRLYRQSRSKFWWVDHTFPNGERIRQSTKKTDKAVARIFAQDIIRQYEERRRISAKKGSFIAEYLEYARPRKNVKTVQNEIKVWNDFTAFAGSDRPIDFTVHMAEKFLTYLLERPHERLKGRKLSAAYVNKYHTTLKMMMNKAVRWKFALENPFAYIEEQRFEPQVPRFLSQQEISVFLKKAQILYPHLVPALQMFLLTGLRRSELFRLEWADIEFEKKYIVVKRTKSKRARFVPLTPMAEKILKGRTKLDRPFMENPDSVTNMVRRITKEAGFPEVSLHDLRRSFATHLAPHVNKTILQQLMGHEDYSVTDVFYIGSNADFIRKEMVVLDRLIVDPFPKN